MDPASAPSPDSPPAGGQPRVVVALDGDEAGMSALRWALSWLGPSPAHLRLMVVETARVARSRVEEQVRAAAQRLGREHAAAVEDALWWTTTAPARVHPLGRALVERLAPQDLLVLGSDRSTRIEGLADTSLPLYIAAIARTRLVVVPRSWAASDRVVLLVGSNDDTDAPLRFAAEQAERRGTALELAHAWQVAPGYPTALASASAGYEAAREDAAHSLTARSGRIRALYPDLPLTEHLLEGPRVSALLPVIQGSGLTVLARHAAGLLRDVLLGSLAHELVATAPCPLAIVPSDSEPVPRTGPRP